MSAPETLVCVRTLVKILKEATSVYVIMVGHWLLMAITALVSELSDTYL